MIRQPRSRSLSPIRELELFTAMPVVIGPYCDKSPALPASMQEQTPTTSRFLDALEKRHEQNRRQMADAHFLLPRTGRRRMTDV